jgi:hypothetical protein
MPIDWTALAAPFPPSELEWRLQQAGDKNGRVWAMVLCYVTNRAIMNRLDEIVGPENWSNSFSVSPGGGVLCGITIRMDDGREVTKYDGAGATDVEAEKGSLSGAMKRAAVQWGIGRYLYNLEEGFANVHEGGAYRGKTKEGKAFKWDPPELPKWALPKPRTNAVEREHAALVAWLKEQGATLDETVSVRINGNPMPLKAYMLAQWPEAQKKYAVASTLAGLVTEATGATFQPSPVA